MIGAIFDLDGTLLDSMPVWKDAGNVFLARLGKQGEEGLDRKLFPLSVLEGAKYLKEHYALALTPQEIVDGLDDTIAEAYRTSIPLKEGARELIKALSRRGIPLAVATATDRPLVETALVRLGVAGYFTALFTCGEVGKGKGESAAVYEAAAASIGVPSAHCWVFEDALHAARTAKNAGFRVVGVYDEASGREWQELSALADVALRDLNRTESLFAALEETE